jgi:hypothetical protein
MRRLQACRNYRCHDDDRCRRQARHYRNIWHGEGAWSHGRLFHCGT